MKKFFVFLTSFALLFNSLVSPFALSYAQEISPTPESTVEPTATPEEIATPSPVEEVAPTPIATDEVTPTPEETIIPTESSTENGHILAVILEDTSAQSIVPDDLTVNTDGSATLQTDKADYAPTDSVLVTGAGFLAGKTYTIVISSSDDPAVTHEDTVTADSEGKIVYSYQLDGVSRPNYKIEVKDGERIVASITFTDPANPLDNPDSTSTEPLSISSIEFQWKDKSTVEDDFHIERKLESEPDSSFSEIATVVTMTKATTGTVYYFTDTGRSCDTEYSYRVRAHRHDIPAYSGYSSKKNQKTLYLLTNGVSDLTPDYVVPGSTNVPLFSFTITSCKSSAKIKSVKVQYTGTHKSDVLNLKLYQESSAVPGVFDAASDTLRDTSSTPGGGSYEFNLDPPDIAIGTSTAQFYVTADISSSATLGNIVDAKILEGKINIDPNNPSGADNDNWPFVSDLTLWNPDGFATIVGSLDTTPPVITPNVSPTPGAGWNNSDVTVSWTVTDPESAVTSETGCGITTVSTETIDQVITCSAISAGGFNSESVTIKLDKTKPIITGSRFPDPNIYGWNNTDVIVGFSCAEEGAVQSGIVTDTVTGVVLSSDGAGQAVSNSGVCGDAAGNTADSVMVLGINIDKSAPELPGLPWTTSPTRFTNQTWLWDPAGDSPSGILQYLWRVPDDGGGTSTGTSADTNLLERVWSFFVKAQDLAGNEGAESMGTVIVDTTPPVTTDDIPDSDWHNSDVTVNLNCTDTNGCAHTYYTIDGSDPTESSTEGTTLTISSDGIYTIKYFSIDSVGNREEIRTAENQVKVDETKPDGSWVAPVEGATVSGMVPLEATASDDTSGIESVRFQYKEGGNEIDTIPGEPYVTNWDTRGLALAAYTLEIVVTDEAGNVSTYERTFNVAAIVSGESGVGTSYETARVTWTTDRLTSSRVVYDTVSHGSLGEAPNYGYAWSTGTGDTDPKVLNHSVSIGGLSAGTVYYYRTISEGSPTAISDQNTLATLSVAGAPDSGPWTGGLVAGISTVATVPWTTSASAYYPSVVEEVKAEETSVPAENKEVLGEETEAGKSRKWVWLVIAIIAFMGFAYLRKRSKKV